MTYDALCTAWAASSRASRAAGVDAEPAADRSFAAMLWSALRTSRFTSSSLTSLIERFSRSGAPNLPGRGVGPLSIYIAAATSQVVPNIPEASS